MKAGLSIVVPLYNEARNLARLHEQLVEVARRLAATRGLAVEAVYVDDGSRDDTLEIARMLPASALDVQVIALSRNFGKEAALAAGLDHARNGALLFMDGDGQHPPALIDTLVGHWLDGGYDVIYTAKAHRENESALRRLGGKGFYALLNWGARHKIPEDAGDFRLLSPRAVDALRRLPERNRFFKGLAEINRQWSDADDIEPKPLQKPRPPIIIGGRAKPRTVRAAVRFADEYTTVSPTVEEARERRRAVAEAAREAARAPLRFSMMIGCVVGRDEAEARDRVSHLRELLGEGAVPPLTGTVDQVAERLREYEAVGVERAMLQHLVHEDVEMVGRLGELAAALR